MRNALIASGESLSAPVGVGEAKAVGVGIHKYADLAKVGGSIGTPSATGEESAIVKADETGKLTGWAAAILAAAVIF